MVSAPRELLGQVRAPGTPVTRGDSLSCLECQIGTECRRHWREFLVTAEMIPGIFCVRGDCVCVGPGLPPAWNGGQHPPADPAGKRQSPSHCADPNCPEQGTFPGPGSKVGLGSASGQTAHIPWLGDREMVITWTSRNLTTPSPKASSELGPERI